MPVLRLNIGGEIFSTTESTLQNAQGDNFFKSLLANIQNKTLVVERDENGIVFVDRSPVHFHHILDYLRDGEIQVNLPLETLSWIRKEAKFYCMNDLIEYLDTYEALASKKTHRFEYNTFYILYGRCHAENQEIYVIIQNLHLEYSYTSKLANVAQKKLSEAGFETVGATVAGNKDDVMQVFTVRKLK
jgi:hypothetical protein